MFTCSRDTRSPRFAFSLVFVPRNSLSLGSLECGTNDTSWSFIFIPFIKYLILTNSSLRPIDRSFISFSRKNGLNFYFPTFGNTDALKDSYRLNSHDSRILKFGHFSFTSNNIRVYLEIEIRERNLENFCSGCFQINGYAPFLISTTYLITLGLSNLSLRFISRHSRQDYPIEKFRIITIPSFISFDKY